MKVEVTHVVGKIGEENDEPDMAVRFEGVEFISEINLPATFGRWEEWWNRIPARERLRALRAAENIQTEGPFVEPTPVATPETDDGGVIV